MKSVYFLVITLISLFDLIFFYKMHWERPVDYYYFMSMLFIGNCPFSKSPSIFIWQAFASLLSCLAFPDGVQSSRTLKSTRKNIPSLLHVNDKVSNGKARKVVHVRRGGLSNLTRVFTATKRINLFCKVGFFLQVSDNGTLTGTRDRRSKNGECSSTFLVY